MMKILTQKMLGAQGLAANSVKNLSFRRLEMAFRRSALRLKKVKDDLGGPVGGMLRQSIARPRAQPRFDARQPL
jgi:hypothetical protein